MPTISVNQTLISTLLSRHGLTNDIERMADQLPLLGTDIDACNSETLDIEIFPDRPDLLSGETLTRAMRPFLYATEAKPSLGVKHGDITMTVDSSLAEVRPIILGAVVRNVDTGKTPEENAAFIKALMDHQEKLHFALGRGRKRASIGVHDLATLSPPFHVKTVTGDTEFTPLAMDKPMSITSILKNHPKGIDYAHLLEGMDRYPVIVDSNQAVLSFPPIINGQHTTVTSSTTDFFIDVTGWDRRACEASLLLVASQLEERGGTIESIEVTDYNGKVERLPNPEPIIHAVTERLLDGLLGRALNDEEIHASINRMGGMYLGRTKAEDAPLRVPKNMADVVKGDGILSFAMPRWRFDILHPIDLVEDVAVGHGYEDLGTDVPRAPLTAIPRADGHIR
ncbi:MAG: phenylalanine--tRNA ligase subunit beta, partial [Euryarchaeota archaeon]